MGKVRCPCGEILSNSSTNNKVNYTCLSDDEEVEVDLWMCTCEEWVYVNHEFYKLRSKEEIRGDALESRNIEITIPSSPCVSIELSEELIELLKEAPISNLKYEDTPQHLLKKYYEFMEQYHCHTGLEPYLNGSVSYEEGDISQYMSKEQFDRLIEIVGDDNG